MKKTLLINPWIYDFSAYDFGIRPVGLLRIGEFLRRKGAKVDLVTQGRDALMVWGHI